MGNRIGSRALHCAALSVALSASAATYSQTDDGGAAVLEEVVVTAQKREQSLQDTALSVSALTEDSMEQLGMTSFRDWANYIPGITVSYGANSRRGGPLAVIRGVVNQVRGAVSDNTANATTAFTIGEVPIFSVSPSLVDLNRIEVLKGPQGTLYGIAAMGGVVKYVPNDAQTDKFSGEINTSGGMIENGGNLYDLSAVANVPIIEGVLAVRGVVAKHSNGGFIDHFFPSLNNAQPLVPGNGSGVEVRPDTAGRYLKDSNKTDSTMGRVSLIYTPNEAFTLKLSSMQQKDESDNAWQVDYNDSLDLLRSRYLLSPQSSEFKLSALEASYDFGVGTLTYVGGYYENELAETIDATRFVTNAWARLNGDTFYPQAVAFPFETKTHQATHELRLQAVEKPLFGSALKFDYVVGVFYQNETRKGGYNIVAPEWNANKGPNTRAISTAGGLLSGVLGSGEYTNKAAFVDATLHFTDKLSAGAGVRRFEQEKFTTNRNYGDVATPTRLPDNLDDPINRADGQPRLSTGTLGNEGYTPRFGVSYKLSENKLLYVTAAEGERIASEPPIASNTTATDPFCAALVQQLNLQDFLRNGNRSDKIWAYDLGIKSMWLDNSLRVNAAAFYVDWTDLQQAVILNSVSPQCSGVIQANVGSARVQGFELEATYALNRHLLFNGSVAHADGEITDPGPGVMDSLGQPLQKGDAISSVPEWTANVGAQLSFNLYRMAEGAEGYLRADWRYVSERINGFGDKPSLRNSIPFNVAGSYQLTDVRLGVDKDAWSGQIYVSNLFDERAVYETMRDFAQVNIQEAAISQPRTIGFRLSRSF